MDPEFLPDWRKKIIKIGISCTEITKPCIFLFSSSSVTFTFASLSFLGD